MDVWNGSGKVQYLLYPSWLGCLSRRDVCTVLSLVRGWKGDRAYGARHAACGTRRGSAHGEWNSGPAQQVC